MFEMTLLHGDAIEQLRTLPSESIHTCVTSPPYYGLRDYGVDGQIGQEETPEEYVDRLVNMFREVRRVLRNDGTLWVNIGDSYAANRTYQVHNSIGAKDHTYSPGSKVPVNCKPKDMIGIPWMLAFALREDGWYLRQDIIWAKSNPMPESVKDRCTKSHEYVFLLSKSKKYYFDSDAIKEPADEKYAKRYLSPFNNGPKERSGQGRVGNASNTAGYKTFTGYRNKRDVWSVSVARFKGAHFAVFPEKLIEPCVLAGCPEGGTVLDPFTGSGTTGIVAKKFGRNFIGVELNHEYYAMAESRLQNTP